MVESGLKLFDSVRPLCRQEREEKENPMKAASHLIILALVVCVLAVAVPAGAQEEPLKNDFRVSGSVLYQGKQAFVINAIETPSLMQASEDVSAFARALARVSEVGANTVCFDLAGFSGDGKTLAPETPAKISKMMGQINYRRMGAICRVFPTSVPRDSSYREAAVKAMAALLQNEKRIIYWIDGPESESLVQALHKDAPKLVIAAERGGDIDVLTAMPSAKPEKPTLVFGSIPTRDLRASVHFMLPDAEESYKALDAAMADPAESKPWTPDNSGLSEQERADGFVSLFDGKTLDGWWILGDNKNGFNVKDGAIEWAGLGGKALYTRDRYDNFILRLEWKINKGGNSGIYLRAPRANRQSKIGMEFQLQGDHGTPITNQTTGSIYVVVPPRENATKPEGEWNSVEISLDGAKMKAVLNGVLIQDLSLDENDELRTRLRRGFIGLQDHAAYAAFRNIRIKKL
jgi:hypothetical protein